MDKLEELQKKQNAVSHLSRWLSVCLSNLYKPVVTDNFTAANLLFCLWVFIFLFSYAVRKKNRLQSSRPARKYPLCQFVHAGQCQCVDTCLCVWADAALFTAESQQSQYQKFACECDVTCVIIPLNQITFIWHCPERTHILIIIVILSKRYHLSK